MKSREVDQPVGVEPTVKVPPKYAFRNESDVKKHVKKLLDAHGYFWWMPAANAFGKSGAADFMAIKHGVFLAIETKFGDRKLTTMQRAFLNSINAENGFGFVVHDKNIAWFDVWLQAFARATVAQSKGQQPSDEDGSVMLNAIRTLQAEVDTTS